MLGWTYNLCLTASSSAFVPAALVVASLNMLIQIAFSVCFGTKGLSKIRGYRGE